ncbi:MAG: TonB-dependent receptor [Tannerellaceae bacterium]|jgi:outer membrane receptor protein involved in Fe transport|nr:TonB-dependent receptor [Tannerellaceae bacterium]
MKAAITGILFMVCSVAGASIADTADVEVKLDEVFVGARKSGTLLSTSSVGKREIITSTGLMKMACCNLSESFENSASVTVGFTDAVSGAKQIQLLGLSGVYSRMLAENIPTLRGLAASFGWSHIPSRWLESIHISKGASSVVNGYESVTGQINLEFVKPEATEPLNLNVYVDDDKHLEGNLTSAIQLNPRWWTALFISGVYGQEVHDENNDNFLDMPKTKYINLYNRWIYLDPEGTMQSRTGIKFLYEDRRAGQDSLCHLKHGTELYENGQRIELFETATLNRNFTVENKTGIAVGSEQLHSLALISSFTHHEQGLRFGRKHFDGIQNTWYANLLFSSPAEAVHRYTAGASFTGDIYRTSFEDNLVYNQTPLTHIDRTELVPGVFGEYTWEDPAGLTLVAGLRTDYNSRFGWLVTPRLNLKYVPLPYLALRASAGRGYRSPNAISENLGLMASSRRFDLTGIDSLDIERAWNFGANLTLTLPLVDERNAVLSFDYFRTVFQSRFVADIERTSHAVFFYNTGHSSADAFQADLTLSPLRGVEVFAAFRYNTNHIDYIDGDQSYSLEQALISRYRGLVNVSYATPLRKWVIDLTAQLNGPVRLPGQNGYKSETIPTPSYPVYFAQLTKNGKYLDIYGGVENILGYTQKDPKPVLNPEYPFEQSFDASQIWAPLWGRRIYLGLRFRLL